MISGIGFQEIILVAVLILVFFGPKGVSGIMRDLGRFVGSLKKYRDEFTRELMAISEPVVDQEEIRRNERERIQITLLNAHATPNAPIADNCLLVFHGDVAHRADGDTGFTTVAQFRSYQGGLELGNEQA